MTSYIPGGGEIEGEHVDPHITHEAYVAKATHDLERDPVALHEWLLEYSPGYDERSVPER
jgi:hypothetical protein